MDIQRANPSKDLKFVDRHQLVLKGIEVSGLTSCDHCEQVLLFGHFFVLTRASDDPEANMTQAIFKVKCTAAGCNQSFSREEITDHETKCHGGTHNVCTDRKCTQSKCTTQQRQCLQSERMSSYTCKICQKNFRRSRQIRKPYQPTYQSGQKANVLHNRWMQRSM